MPKYKRTGHLRGKYVPAQTMWHGTAGPEFEQFKGLTFLTTDPAEATAFALHPVLVMQSKGKGEGIPRRIAVSVPEGYALDISDGVNQALEEDNVDEYIEQMAKEAKKMGLDYLFFWHPGIYREEIPVYVSVNPEKLKIDQIIHLSERKE